MMHERSSDKSLANISNTFVAKVVCELKPIVLGLVPALSAKELETFWIPSTTGLVSLVSNLLQSQTNLPRECLRADVFVELQITHLALDRLDSLCSYSRVQEILVAQHHHASNMEIVLAVLRLSHKRGYGCGHLQETVTQKLESLIVGAHATLELDLLFFMIARVFGVFG
jgi:hypothetical protein